VATLSRPRAFVATRWSRDGDADVLAMLASGRWQERFVAIPEAPTAAPAESAIEPGACEFGPYRPERVELRCASAAGGYAVLLDEWAPGWSARVDGRPAPILRADTIFRAVGVPPGEHVVVLDYRTPGLRAGAAISFAAWTSALALLLIARRAGFRVNRMVPEEVDAPPRQTA